MVLVAKGWHRDVALPGLAILVDPGFRELHSPSRITILLAQLRRLVLPAIRDLARLDVGLLGVGVALLRRRDDRGVDDLTTHGEITGLGQMLVETGKQVVHCTGLGEVLAEQPYRLGIGNPVAKTEAKEPHEGKPVLDLEFGLVIRQAVERLQHHDLEHQHRVIGRTPTLCAI